MLTRIALKSTRNTNRSKPRRITKPLKVLGETNGFQWRSHEITRIEGLSDAVFAFAVTLLIVSLEVPKSYEELIHNLHGFLAFAACFAQLMVVWYHQYLYYRRYNLQDFRSTLLSMALLFVVLFYTYPLKFVFSAFLTPLLESDYHPFRSIDQVRSMFAIYGIGVIAVFSVFASMYYHAYKMREALALTTLERHDTLHTLREMLLYAVVAVISIVLAFTVPDEWAGIGPGLAYSLTGVVMAIHGKWSGRTRSHLEHELSLKTAEA